MRWILFVTFVIILLKIVGVVEASWLVVLTSPIWIPLVLMLTCLGLVLGVLFAFFFGFLIYMIFAQLQLPYRNAPGELDDE